MPQLHPNSSLKEANSEAVLGFGNEARVQKVESVVELRKEPFPKLKPNPEPRRSCILYLHPRSSPWVGEYTQPLYSAHWNIEPKFFMLTGPVALELAGANRLWPHGALNRTNEIAVIRSVADCFKLDGYLASGPFARNKNRVLSSTLHHRGNLVDFFRNLAVRAVVGLLLACERVPANAGFL